MPEQRGILAIWHDIRPESREDTLLWYDREHHLERLAVPGFLSVRRYHAASDGPLVFVRYETSDVGVLSSAPYLARLNDPTPWTRRAQPSFLANSRTVCIREGRAGWAESGTAVTIRLRAAGPLAPPLDWAGLSDALMRMPGVVGAESWRADAGRATAATGETRLRGAEDSHVDRAVIVHARDLDAAWSVAGAGLPARWLAGHSAEIGIYQLAAASFHNMS